MKKKRILWDLKKMVSIIRQLKQKQNEKNANLPVVLKPKKKEMKNNDHMMIRMIRGFIRIWSGSDPILIRIVFFDPFGSADYEFTIRSGSDPYPIRGSRSDRIFCGTLIEPHYKIYILFHFLNLLQMHNMNYSLTSI